MTAQSKLAAAKEAARDYMQRNHPTRTWFLVGGAIRDTDFGIAFKDVDIFVSGYETDPDPKAELGDRNAYLMRAYSEWYMGFEINIIFMRRPWTLEQIADRCDFGICQTAWCPVTDRTYRSDAYAADLNNHTLTIARSTHPDRFVRMKAKFPSFTFNNPRNLPAATGGWHYVNGEVVRKP